VYAIIDEVDSILIDEARTPLIISGPVGNESDEEYAKTWAMTQGDKEVFSAPKGVVMRSFVMNHLVHHRGQLTVFLRLNDVPLPMTYGPSADESGGS